MKLRNLIPLAMLALLTFGLAGTAWTHKVARAPVSVPSGPSGVIDSLRLQITTCDEPYQLLPGTPVQVLHRRAGNQIATYEGIADGNARLVFAIADLVPLDSAYVTIHPPGWPQRDSEHRYEYRGGSQPETALSAGVWDLGQSLVTGCHDDKQVTPVEIIFCRYRPSSTEKSGE